ncbi:anthranilate synthase component II [Desulfosudis oleivorans]|uniref:Glutamine amidotransferase of anthranilate synthase n=1 Tax=Desulfosudis oleivorans (strain DSM 6200 / JCM 39069 / Hxd3) TaxID=96561 RepID=A8ZZX2_DESOH|nr:aminodeoxychorismate/anthranilate synthase component II [Desulfosudis oleivorans]ABW67372.1 glutamine amidotransferase of anthranilate synthase [Desulfosudis oleivorans Hxd3]
MILMIDNYDSFTYNLVQYLRMLSAEVLVARNDEITVAEVDRMAPSHIVISPGPGRPDSAGISLDLIRHASGRAPILGVCLGHQAIGQAFGGTIVAARRLMHGKTSAVTTGPVSIFEGIPSPFTAMRYHSLAVEKKTLPDCLEICAEDEDGEIMGMRHRQHPTVGIQFHPESIMTPKGKRILKNFLTM